MLPLLAFENPLDEVLPHTFFKVAGFPVTNVVIMSGVAAVLMLLIFPRLFNRPTSGVPTGSKNFFEAILEFLRVEVFRPALKEHTDQFVPFLWTLFFFILFCNVLGCIPFAAIFTILSGGHVEHLGGAATGNISVTLALALCAFVYIHAKGIDQIARSLMDGTYGHHDHGHAEHGREDAADLEHFRGEALSADVGGDFGALTDPTAHYKDEAKGHDTGDEPHGGKPRLNPANTPTAHEANAALAIDAAGEKMTPMRAMLTAVPIYLWNFAPHPFRPPPGSPWTKWIPDLGMFAFLLVLEMIGAAVKPFALCIRLFANMVAGHILLAVLIGLITFVPRIGVQLAIGVPVTVLDIFIQLLEVFVAFLQAYIFVFLTTLFLASAVAPEH